MSVTFRGYIFVIFHQIIFKLSTFTKSQALCPAESTADFLYHVHVKSRKLTSVICRRLQQQQQQQQQKHRNTTAKHNESSENHISDRRNFLKQIQGHEKKVKSKKVLLSVTIRVNIKNLPQNPAVFVPYPRESLTNVWFLLVALVAIFVKFKCQVKILL